MYHWSYRSVHGHDLPSQDAFNPVIAFEADPFNAEDVSFNLDPHAPPHSAQDDGFGPFSDAAAASGTDPFTFSSSLSDELDDSSFESFGDFGDFQGGSGELTPTGDSWTFASASSSGTSESEGKSSDGEKRTGGVSSI